MSIASMLSGIYKKVKWIPLIDVCSDSLGANSTAILFFSAASDMFAQKYILRGNYLICNPPYPETEKYVDFILDEIFAHNNETRCLFVVPDRDSIRSGKWQKRLDNHAHTSLIEVYTTKATCFLQTKFGQPHAEKRPKAKNNVEYIHVWELNSNSVTKQLKLIDYPDPKKEQCGEIERVIEQRKRTVKAE